VNHIYISVINDLVSDARMHRTCITLLKSGAKVKLIGRKFKNSPDISNREYHGKRFRFLVNKGPVFYLMYNIRLFFYLLTREKSSILLACDLDTLPANFLASHLRGFTLLYDSHEYFTEVPELKDRPFVRNIWLMIERFILPRLKYAYTVSEAIAAEYSKLYGVNFEVIRNLPLTRNKIENYPLPDWIQMKKKIIYQGAVNIGRGIEEVIEALKKMENVVFIIAGEGDIYQSLKDFVNREKLNNKVYFTGRIALNQLPGLTIQGDIGISLEHDLGKSYRYALPNKVFDYIQAGVPALVADLPVMRKVVDEFNIGMIAESHEADYLKEKLEFMLNNAESRKLWIKNCREAAEELCWEKEESKMISFFKKTGLTFPD
jgi:glycosyltransferase involved in cell wall biosynthesis